MTILVCPLSQVDAQIKAHKPARIVSLLDPDTPFPHTGYAERHLRIAVHDVEADAPGWMAPDPSHVERLLHFVFEWDGRGPLLIHCHAGISRSTASAFITACARNPHMREGDILADLHAASPTARPNGRLVRMADDLLGRDGRMLRALEQAGAELDWTGAPEAVPFAVPSQYGLSP